MFKKYRILKWILISLIAIIITIVSFGFWFKSLIPPRDVSIEDTQIKDIPYLSENIIPVRGKILTVVTSANKMGTTDKKTGYELSELARAYYVFQANGFEVDIASPKGGKPTVIIDDEDMVAIDFAFLNDSVAQRKANNTIAIKDVVAEDYEALFFVGGKGTMFDFPDNTKIQEIIRNRYQSNKVIGAVCHGPAALINVTLDNGKSLLENKKVSGFTNEEELLLIPEAKTIFPFLLQDKLSEKGANFKEGEMYLEQVCHDGNLVTGQNPWSTWKVVETMIKQLGYTPKHREITDDENAEKVLAMYRLQGKQKAKELIEQLSLKEKKPIKRVLIAKHAIVSAMKGEVSSFFDMIGLTSFAKECEEKQLKI